MNIENNYNIYILGLKLTFKQFHHKSLFSRSGKFPFQLLIVLCLLSPAERFILWLRYFKHVTVGTFSKGTYYFFKLDFGNYYFCVFLGVAHFVPIGGNSIVSGFRVFMTFRTVVQKSILEIDPSLRC